jgi:hypothetical protein
VKALCEVRSLNLAHSPGDFMGFARGKVMAYEPVPSVPLPAMPDLAARTANLWTE